MKSTPTETEKRVLSTEDKLITDAIDLLAHYISREGCNDLELEDTPENRALVEEADAANYRLTVEQWREHEDYDAPRVHNGKILTHDGLMTYVVRKRCFPATA